MFDILAGSRFSGGDDDEAKDRASYILACDLLIIDDLGTELINTFTASQMFYCVNERLNRNKGTIISTNLTLGELQDAFTERVTSRIMSRMTSVSCAEDLCAEDNKTCRDSRRKKENPVGDGRKSG